MLTPALSPSITPENHVLAVNGEIYNHQTLRARSMATLRVPDSPTAKLFLALYQEKGPDFLDDLLMFAFAPV